MDLQPWWLRPEVLAVAMGFAGEPNKRLLQMGDAILDHPSGGSAVAHSRIWAFGSQETAQVKVHA
jgi:hypothetical protein